MGNQYEVAAQPSIDSLPNAGGYRDSITNLAATNRTTNLLPFAATRSMLPKGFLPTTMRRLSPPSATNTTGPFTRFSGKSAGVCARIVSLAVRARSLGIAAGMAVRCPDESTAMMRSPPSVYARKVTGGPCREVTIARWGQAVVAGRDTGDALATSATASSPNTASRVTSGSLLMARTCVTFAGAPAAKHVVSTD